MQIELVQTFLEVSRTQHFARAAGNLHVTQAAVSARIRALEDHLGTPLFTRDRNNIRLTPAGEQLLPQAEVLLSTWRRMQVQSRAMASRRRVYNIASLPSISEQYVPDWLLALHPAPGNALLQWETANNATLVRRLQEGSVDLALLYERPAQADLELAAIANSELILVTTDPATVTVPFHNYVYVDWGTSFQQSHQLRWGSALEPTLHTDTPAAAQRFLLQHGGTAYLEARTINRALQAGQLRRVPDAEPIRRTIYAAYALPAAQEPAADDVLRAVVARLIEASG